MLAKNIHKFFLIFRRTKQKICDLSFKYKQVIELIDLLIFQTFYIILFSKNIQLFERNDLMKILYLFVCSSLCSCVAIKYILFVCIYINTAVVHKII